MENNQNEIINELIPLIDAYGIHFVLKYLFISNIKVVLPFSSNDLDKDIDEMDFSTRVKNSLHRTNPPTKTIRDAVNLISSNAISSIRNFGKKSENELKTRLLIMSWESMNLPEKEEFCRRLLADNTRG